MTTTRGTERSSGSGETMGERLQKYLADSNISQAELARMAGVKQQTINYLINRRSTGSSYAIKIANALGINPVWLQEGCGNPHEPNALGAGSTASGGGWLPVLRADELEDFIARPTQHTATRVLATTLPVKKGAFAMEVEGAANEPEFREGDQVVVDRSVTPSPGDFVVAAFRGEYALRKYRVVEATDAGETFAVAALNPDYPLICSAKTRIDIVGTVVEHRRRLKAL